MHVQKIKKIKGVVGEVLGGKTTTAGFITTAITLVIFFWDYIVGFYETVKDAKEWREQIQVEITSKNAKIDSLQKTLDYVVYQDGEFMEMMIADLTEMEKSLYERDRIIMEELDRVDTLGQSFEMTNPGNLYYYQEGHFYSPRYDRKERKWFINIEGSRSYLVSE